MRNFFSQPKLNITRAVIALVMTLVFIVFFSVLNLKEMNYTGLLNDSPHPFFFRLCASVIWCVSHFLLYRKTKFISHRYLQTALTFLIGLVAVFIPYTSAGALCSNLHIFTACTAFLLFNLLVYESCLLRQSDYCLYILLVLPAFAACLKDMSINGTAETIYMWGLSMWFLITFA